MPARPEIVITGVGIICPIGIGSDACWEALRQRRSGIAPATRCDLSGIPVRLAGEVPDYEPKQYVRPRKSLKVMSRPMQLGVTVAQFAWEEAGFAEGDVDPDRVGVVFGADNICSPVEEGAESYVGGMTDGSCEPSVWQAQAHERSFPLGMLRTLPNLVACHVSISLDARGPNNTHHSGDVSALMAISESMRVIERGAADVVVAGGASSLSDAYDWARCQVIDEMSHAAGEGTAPRPFDLERDGQVRGEGAAALILESRRHAEARGAKILARLPGYGEATYVGQVYGSQDAASARCKGLVRAMDIALRDSGLSPSDVGHFNAHGLGTLHGDRQEAAAISQVFNGVPVTAPKSFIGNLGAAAGAVETALSVLALSRGEVPVTLNHRRPDPACPLKVVHDEALTGTTPVAIVVNQTPLGQAAAVVVTGA